MRKSVWGFCVAIVVLVVAWLAWPRMPEYVTWRTASMNGRRVEFMVVELPRSLWEWDVVEDVDNPKTVKEWREALGADIVFNAAYFNEDYTASGFMKEGKGPSRVPWPTREEQADPYGYTFLVHNLHSTYLPRDPQEEPVGDAFLSFPTLVVDGQPIVAEDSQKYAARTMLAEDVNGNSYMVITTEGSVSLYEAAQWLAAQPEQFTLAGNLDGGPSTGVSIENKNRDIEDASAPVPSVIAGYSSEGS